MSSFSENTRTTGAEQINNWQENITGTIGNVVFQKNNRLRVRKIQGQRRKKRK